MNWRAPWLRDRAIPLLMALLDVAMIMAVYGVVAKVRTGHWFTPGNGGTYATWSWITASYVLGRYSKGSRSGPRKIWRETALQVACATAIVWTGFIAHSWTYQIIDAQTRFRGFLVPALAAIACLGFCIRIAFLNLGRRAQKYRCLIVCSEREKAVLKRELQESELCKAEFCEIREIRDKLTEGASIAIGEGINPEKIGYFYLADLRANGTKVETLNNWCENTLNRIPSELIDERWFLLSEGFAVQPGRIWWRIKRIGDIATAGILGLLAIPLLSIACFAIWLEDGGPVFYGQERTGIYGSRIRIWKLRSMRLDAERNGPRWATKGDTRVTKVGTVIRKTRIDELPQLWSVIVGDLSLIGPRPERPEMEEELEQQIANYRTREWIRPGLSGWAQVSYPYGASVKDSRAKLSYDLYYLKNAGLLMDILILLKTIRLVVRAEGSTPLKE